MTETDVGSYFANMLLGLIWETFPSLIDNKKGIAIESDFADRRWLCIEQISPNMPACQIQDTNSFFRHRRNSEISHYDVAYRAMVSRVQRVPVTWPLPDIFSDTRLDPVWKKNLPCGLCWNPKIEPQNLSSVDEFSTRRVVKWQILGLTIELSPLSSSQFISSVQHLMEEALVKLAEQSNIIITIIIIIIIIVWPILLRRRWWELQNRALLVFAQTWVRATLGQSIIATS